MDLEMHFVHLYSDDMSLGAVLGVFFDREAGGDVDNDFIESFIQGGFSNPAGKTLDVKQFIESLDTSEFWSYNGSLTTPPCTE